MKFCWNIEVCAVQNHGNILDLVKSFLTSIYKYRLHPFTTDLQKLVSIQSRTSRPRFADTLQHTPLWVISSALIAVAALSAGLSGPRGRTRHLVLHR